MDKQPKKKVLIVDDDHAFCESLRLLLTYWGYEVRFVQDGDSALTEFRSWEPDLVLTDILHPGPSGVELLIHIKTVKRSVPVVIATAFCSSSWRDECLGLGAFAFLEKPFDYDELRLILAAALTRAPDATCRWCHGTGLVQGFTSIDPCE